MFHRSANLIITCSIMSFLALAAVALRLWARSLRKIIIGADDVFIIVGLILALGICACNILGTAKYRLGNYAIFYESGPLEGFPIAYLLLGNGKILYAEQPLHATAMPIIKVSLVLFLRRIFSHHQTFRNAAWVVGAYVFLWWLTTFWMSVFQCWPISANRSTMPDQARYCIPNYVTWCAWAALLNVLSNVAIVLIPIPLIWSLQMSTKQKLASASILITAVIVINVGIGRAVEYFRYDPATPDFTYGFYYFVTWTTIEPSLGIVGCCIPTLGRLLDLNFSVLYSKISNAFPLQSLRRMMSKRLMASRSKQNNDSVELMNETPHRSEPSFDTRNPSLGRTSSSFQK